MKRIMLVFLVVMTLTSCQRGCSRIEKKYQASERDYEIIKYSGGQVVYHDKVRTIINSEENSDGIYYYKNDTLVEVSGDYVLKSTR